MNTYADQIAIKVKIIRYILAMADDRVLLHGEKHHIIQVCLMLLHNLESELGGSSSLLERHDEPILSADEIPF